MLLGCYTWIVHLFKKITGGPDDDLTAVKVNTVVGDLGNQDPTALKFKVELSSMTVVKVEVKVDLSPITTFPRQIDQIYEKWLMLTPSLSVEHCRRRLILRFYGIFVCSRFYITDGKSEKLCKKLDAVVSGHVVSFCNGLALLSTHYLTNQHLVFNPVSNKITTTISPLSSEDSLCALFFHPVAKEYRILNVLKRRADHYVYYLYLFGSKTWRRTAKPSFHSRPPNIKKYYYHTKMFNKNPAIANGAVHWYVRGGQILTFDMIKEEFCFKPLPFRGFYGEKGYCLPDVLVNEEEDRLCCCYMGSPEPVMDVWVMEDYAKWAWIRKYVVNMDWDAIEYPLIGGLRVGAHLLVDVLVVSIHKDELVLFWHNRGMFSYRLGDNTIEKIKLREMDEYEYTPPSFGYMGCCTANH